MLVLGLLIVAATVAFAIVVIADNLGGGPHYSVSLFDHHLATVSTLGAFLAGLALALLFAVGLMMMSAGARHERRRRAELRAARRELKAAEQTAPAASADEDTVTAPTLTKRRSRTPHLFSH